MAPSELEGQVSLVRFDASRRGQSALSVQRRAHLVGDDDAAKWRVLHELFALFPTQLMVRVEEHDVSAAAEYPMANAVRDTQSCIYVFQLAPTALDAFERYCEAARASIVLVT